MSCVTAKNHPLPSEYSSQCWLGRCTLQRLFSAFPGGPPGIGLLILRAATGATLAAQGLICLSSHFQESLGLLATEALLVATGLFILMGLLTPIFSVLATAECLSLAIFGISRSCGFLDSKLIVLQVIAGLIAIAFLGPGAFSFDARLFGWKEIVIPAAPHKPEE